MAHEQLETTGLKPRGAPAAGLPEDPVTGSVHGPLATLLIRGRRVAPSQPGDWSFLCRQVPASGRVGTVHVRAPSRTNWRSRSAARA